MLEIKCKEHPEQDIILVDLNRNSKLQRRTLCSFCTENEKFSNLCPIEQLYGKIEEFQSQKQQEIEAICNFEQTKLQSALKLLVTLRFNLDQVLNLCINETEQLLLSFNQKVKYQQQLYSNLLDNLTQTKVEEIADLLSGKTSYVSIIFHVQEVFEEISSRYCKSFQELEEYQKEVLESISRILLDKWQEKNQVAIQGKCQVLAIIGDRGNREVNICLGIEGSKTNHQKYSGWHSDSISALVFLKSGDMFVSSGDNKAKCLKLWECSQGKWKCVNKMKTHKGGVIAMKLTPNEEFLVTAGRDNKIMIWNIDQEKRKLAKIQNLLRDHKTPIFSIAISPDSQLLSISSTGIQVYHGLGEQGFDKNMEKILNIQFQNQIQLGRLYFVDNQELIAQRLDSPMLMIIKLVSISEYYISQTIKLNEQCNDFIRFQVFQVGNFIYFYNTSVYIIQKAMEESYYIHQRIIRDIVSGCVDANGIQSLLSSIEDQQIKFFGQFTQKIKDC